MTRKTFSIDHKDNWLDSDDPPDRFFDLENIGFSHLNCNIRAARRPNRISDEELAGLEPEHRKKVLSRRSKVTKRDLND